MDGTLLQRWAPRMLSILRIVAGFLFMPNGTLKLFNYPPLPHPMPHLPPLMLVHSGDHERDAEHLPGSVMLVLPVGAHSIKIAQTMWHGRSFALAFNS